MTSATKRDQAPTASTSILAFRTTPPRAGLEDGSDHWPMEQSAPAWSVGPAELVGWLAAAPDNLPHLARSALSAWSVFFFYVYVYVYVWAWNDQRGAVVSGVCLCLGLERSAGSGGVGC